MENRKIERKEFLKSFAFIALMPTLFLAACSDQNAQKTAKGKVKTYTCSMHPQIIQDKPGTCPICGMDLVPFEKNAADPGLTLDQNQIALANITTAVLGSGSFNTYKQLNGRLAVNPEKTEFVSSRTAGRLEHLYVRQTGEKISKGQPLYQIYSEQLAALQQEYLLNKAQVSQFPDDQTFARLLQSAKQKLSLYGQSAKQIQQLEEHKKTNPYVTYSAPEDGTVAELSAVEGQYVAEGGQIMRLEGYHSLWVEADLYPAEARSIKQGQQVKVVITGWEDQPQMMTVKFINPDLQAGTQVLQIRGTIPNPNMQWQPGLQANIFLPSAQNNEAISLPVDAVIRDGQTAHVWIEKSKGKFEPQIVALGIENENQVVIKEGLKTGDQVVITGAYLLYSEYILKKGKNPTAGMKI